MSEQASPTEEERNLAMAAHLLGFAGYIVPLGNIIAPLVLWQLKKDMPFVDYHGREAVNFQITITLYVAVAFVLILTLIGALIGVPMLFAVAVFALVMMIVAAIRARDGGYYQYPATLRLLKPDGAAGGDPYGGPPAA